ncbi:MAG: hypothetical protein IPN29_20140 [Saprospiraceae bacterium]|nr:hypothetical protein [Saprospiraceae bacterium]
MKKLFFAIILFFAMSFSTLSAQQDYVWEYYGLEVTVPDDFEVVKNSDTEFEMKGVGMGFYMYLFEEDIAVEDMDVAVVDVANSIAMEEIDAAQVIQGSGLDGYYVEGYKEGLRVMLAGMIDPKTQTNFFMLITFYDTDNVAESDALDIIHSVRTR